MRCINLDRTPTANDNAPHTLSRRPRILMVSPEYPPINGGVGRYAYNQVQEFKRQDIDVYVACDNRGNGDWIVSRQYKKF